MLFGNKYLIHFYLDDHGGPKIGITHYDCDGEIFTFSPDADFDITLQKVVEHHGECIETRDL